MESHRPWRLITAEVSQEPDHQRLSELMQELGDAPDAQEIAFTKRVQQIAEKKLQGSLYP
jgi:hypothetical protein